MQVDKKRLLPYLALGLFAGEVLLVLVSWLLAAAFPMSGYRSLLSSEGLRWLLGRYSDLLASPALTCLLLLSIAGGCLWRSGLYHHLRTLSHKHSYRERRAMMLTMLAVAVYIVAILLLAVIPHAVLLSATGSLWPSPFSASLVPLLCFGTTVCSCGYGLVAGRMLSLCDCYEAMLDGIRWCAPCFLFYILLVQFAESLTFVF